MQIQLKITPCTRLPSPIPAKSNQKKPTNIVKITAHHDDTSDEEDENYVKNPKKVATAPAKGQLISECLFDNLKFSKKPTKNLTDFCPRI